MEYFYLFWRPVALIGPQAGGNTGGPTGFLPKKVHCHGIGGARPPSLAHTSTSSPPRVSHVAPPRRPYHAPLSRTQYAFIKRVSGTAFEDEAFAEIELCAGDNVARLTGRACDKFPHWGAHEGQVHLLLAAASGADRPTPAALAAVVADPTTRLSENWLLSRAGIEPGCWLLARVPPPAAAAPGA